MWKWQQPNTSCTGPALLPGYLRGRVAWQELVLICTSYGYLQTKIEFVAVSFQLTKTKTFSKAYFVSMIKTETKIMTVLACFLKTGTNIEIT